MELIKKLILIDEDESDKVKLIKFLIQAGILAILILGPLNIFG